MVEVWAAPTGPVDAVLAFTAHHVVAAAVDPDLVAARLPDGDLSAPMGPAFLGWLGERLGSLDVVLAADGLGGSPPLELTPGVDVLVQARGEADRPVGGVALLGADCGLAIQQPDPDVLAGERPRRSGPERPLPGHRHGPTQRRTRARVIRVPRPGGPAGMGPWRATDPRPTATGSPTSTTP